MELTTLCYIEKDDKYLMLHRVKKEKDINKDKWIGIGGHFEQGESPEECLLREAKEETGLVLTEFQFRGIITFSCDDKLTEYMHLYTATKWEGDLITCEEGDLEWVEKDKLLSMNLWEGDYIFLNLLEERNSFFSLKLTYEKNVLREAVLDGTPMELFDICDKDGRLLGRTRERTLVHRYGDWHRTVHVWIVRKKEEQDGGSAYEILLQKRSHNKDAFPDCYDISSAGHMTSGEEFAASAVRELQEELGVYAKEEELVFLGYHRAEVETEFYGKPFVNREYSAVYLLERDIPLNDFLLQEEEVSEVVYMDLEECCKSIENGEIPNCIFLDELEMIKVAVHR